MSLGPDGRIIEERLVTPIGDTASVPVGTNVTVPTAPPTGSSGTAPIVAVNTIPWYKDAGFMSAAGGAILALAEPLIQALQAKGPINWRSLALGCLLAIIAWIRNRTNTVVK